MSWASEMVSRFLRPLRVSTALSRSSMFPPTWDWKIAFASWLIVDPSRSRHTRHSRFRVGAPGVEYRSAENPERAGSGF